MSSHTLSDAHCAMWTVQRWLSNSISFSIPGKNIPSTASASAGYLPEAFHIARGASTAEIRRVARTKIPWYTRGACTEITNALPYDAQSGAMDAHSGQAFWLYRRQHESLSDEGTSTVAKERRAKPRYNEEAAEHQGSSHGTIPPYSKSSAPCANGKCRGHLSRALVSLSKLLAPPKPDVLTSRCCRRTKEVEQRRALLRLPSLGLRKKYLHSLIENLPIKRSPN